jgi:hypothetical protein
LSQVATEPWVVSSLDPTPGPSTGEVLGSASARNGRSRLDTEVPKIVELPETKPTHLRSMTDSIGLLQRASYVPVLGRSRCCGPALLMALIAMGAADQTIFSTTKLGAC